jgi:hypothetical protein
MKSKQWILKQLKEAEAIIQEDEIMAKKPRKPSKKSERFFTERQLFDAVVFGVRLGQRDILRKILELPKK